MKNLTKIFIFSVFLAPFVILTSACQSSKPDIKEPIPVRVAVTGAVMRPGQKIFWINNENPKPPTVVYAIGIAGGPAAGAYMEEVVLHKGGLSGSSQRVVINIKDIMTAENPREKDYPLEDGDVIEVYTMAQFRNIVGQ